MLRVFTRLWPYLIPIWNRVLRPINISKGELVKTVYYPKLVFTDLNTARTTTTSRGHERSGSYPHRAIAVHTYSALGSILRPLDRDQTCYGYHTPSQSYPAILDNLCITYPHLIQTLSTELSTKTTVFILRPFK